jgi:hypothetical protein
MSRSSAHRRLDASRGAAPSSRQAAMELRSVTEGDPALLAVSIHASLVQSFDPFISWLDERYEFPATTSRKKAFLL